MAKRFENSLKTLLKENELHLWVVQATHTHPRKESLLSTQEQARTIKFHNPTTGERWAYFHCALREILARYTDYKPAQLEFDTVKSNKPVLKNQSAILHFNLTHSHDMALVAVSNFFEVGVDIERIRQLNDMENIVNRNFSLEEQKALFALPAEERCRSFYEFWTRKEAVIKANGKGLSIGLHDFTVTLGKTGTWQSAEITGECRSEYLLSGFDLDRDYCAAVCIGICSAGETHPPVLRLNQYQESL